MTFRQGQAETLRVVEVGGPAALRDAVRKATAGTVIRVAPGESAGGLYFENVRGEAGRPVVIEALDPKRPPVFRGRTEGMHFSRVSHLELRNLHLLGATGNGLNMDDGGTVGASHHVTLSGLRVGEMDARGNHDGIKLSGLSDFRLENCAVERWGVGGQGIDMVGCHRGVIEGCLLRHVDEEASAGVQMKGGTADVTVRRCRFERAGGRAVNCGGSTGLRFFRPELDLSPGGRARNAEGRRLVVEGCTFVGSGAPVAFVGVDGAGVRFNTFYLPRNWIVRILQETREPSFVPSRNGAFEDNLVVFRSDWREGGVNVGPGTAPQTFRFARNVWYAVDDPKRSRPRLPAAEIGGVYGQDPRLRDPERGDFSVPSDSPASEAGAHAFKPAK